jgi:hypothetical protein
MSRDARWVLTCVLGTAAVAVFILAVWPSP